MANPLDLEEQEQLDQIKHFWKQYGNAITGGVIVVLGTLASWNLYNYWQHRQASQAAALFDEVERTVQQADIDKIDRVFTEMKDRFSSTSYAQQAGLLVAKHYVNAGKLDAAQSALNWVAEKSSDSGYQAIAKLRLAAVRVEKKDYPAALGLLTGSFPDSFGSLVADRKGDVLMLQGNRAAAIAEYEKAYQLFEARTEYRRLVEAKLNALGIDVQGRNQVVSATQK